ncbi:acetylornithine transaminase [Candidatus Formimonas warabiya]|uniref:Acetylornithine aminotransferase n=1 Tax=Formimonas warabiya TaxID=1761012 RepID=A0A3G1KXM6_FORW1|nr:acetylornithine transaminase [Candidatus Formimonas warabiya]ATW27238.1 aspartate aminotransferase family protein [Candidatus Formimonas warabiya]
MNNEEIVAEGKKYVMNTYGRLPMAIVKGKGASVWDADGKEYLDFVSGIAVNNVGHCHPKVVQAIAAQAETLFHCSNLYWIEPQVKLAKILVENSAFDKVFFCNSGAEANEGALKLARKYAKKHLGEDKYEIITMKKSFHGRTLATLTATGQDKFHKGYEPLPEGFQYAPFNDLDALQEAIGPHTCAVMLEPVQGEGGVMPGEESFIKGVRELCDRHHLLFIVDEVQCGLGRTGKLFAYQHYGVEPDIMTLAKALGGGAPIGALLAKEEVANAFQPGDHASTFGGNPLVTAAGVAALTAILEEGMVDNSAMVGEYLIHKLECLRHKFDFIKEVRGKGLLVGVECAKEVAPVVASCQEKGLLLLSAGPHVLRFVPPLNITFTQVDQAVAILEQAFDS